VFQLHPNQVKFKNKLDGNKKYAIRCFSGYLSVFGLASDFCIFDKSIREKSYSHLGSTYELPQGFS
jgi:hypothetical protein